MKSNDRKRSAPKRRGLRQKEPDANQNTAGAEGQTRIGVLGDFLDTEELALELDVAKPTLVRWRLQKRGPPVTRLGRRILYRRSSVQTWLTAQEQQWARS
jgi:predicted DNA-binding transcriptional regulator AlpA